MGDTTALMDTATMASALLMLSPRQLLSTTDTTALMDTATMASAPLMLSPRLLLSTTDTTALMDTATMASDPLMLSPRLLPHPTADMAMVEADTAEAADMATMASALLSLRLLLSTTDTTTALMDMDTMAKFNTKIYRIAPTIVVCKASHDAVMGCYL